MPSRQVSTTGAEPSAGEGWGTHGRGPRATATPRNPVQSSPLNGATGTFVGPLTVRVGALPQVVFTFQPCTTKSVLPSVSGDPCCTRYAGDPGGGGVRLSRSAGSAPP